VITCPNCGTANESNNRFCMECGADLSSLAPSTGTPSGDQARDSPAAPPSTSPPSGFEPAQPWAGSARARTGPLPTDPDWKMSDPGPLPEPKRRRGWLWVVVGLVAALLLCCCLFFVYINTIGEDWWHGIETRIAEEQTETAR
jgi:hypothetical protein